jgi:hypothetical protein
MNPDMCTCPVPLINEWLNVDGHVIETRQLTAGTGAMDADDFMANPDAAGWRVVCPCCRRIYANG